MILTITTLGITLFACLVLLAVIVIVFGVKKFLK